MIVETKNGPISLPANPPGGGYFLSADGMEPIPLTTEQLWRLAPQSTIAPTPPGHVAMLSEEAIGAGGSSAGVNPPSSSVSAAHSGGGSAAVRTEGVTSSPTLPAGPITGWPLFLYTAISAGIGAFLAVVLVLKGSGAITPPGPPPEPTPPPVSLSPLGASLKTYVHTVPGEFQSIGQRISTGELKTQKEILSVVAAASKSTLDQIYALVGTSTSPGQYTDARGNVTNAAALGQAIAAAGKEAAK